MANIRSAAVGRETDAYILEQAAEILQRRSRKPKGFGLSVAVGVLRRIADDIRTGKL